ncbi:uncharacterized protein LOC113235776 [Hyposmocoma kahamanoa]|uniref:uncharacterized protein LOC113235776 n=1 Tax=Hyposmocoma kahamanoa TaxID=1477025 RepID=UPI000E6D9273|nr:uncharacterized protein LOC113235776 [Hyposmocoma kahamanoa]
MCAFDQWKNNFDKQIAYFSCEASGTRIIDCINKIGWDKIRAIVCAASKVGLYRMVAMNKFNNLQTNTTPVISIGNKFVTQTSFQNAMYFACTFYKKWDPVACMPYKPIKAKFIKTYNPNLKSNQRTSTEQKVVNIFSDFSKSGDQQFFKLSFPKIVSYFGKEVQYDFHFIDKHSESSKRMCALGQWRNDYDKQASYFKCLTKNITHEECIKNIGQNDIDKILCASVYSNKNLNSSRQYFQKLNVKKTPVLTIGTKTLENLTYLRAKGFICYSFDKWSKYVCPDADNDVDNKVKLRHIIKTRI